MRVVLRFGKGIKIGSRPARGNRRAALVVSAMLTPVAAGFAILGMWRLAADLELASAFVITTGIFSHWQVWLAGAVGLEVCARKLTRYARREERARSAGAGAV